MLPITAAVGAGAPPVDDAELDGLVAVEDSACWGRAVADVAELTAAVRDEATEDSGILLESPPTVLM
jgi:hypothetical protein